MLFDSYVMWQLTTALSYGDFIYDAVLYVIKIMAGFYKVQ